MKLKITFLLLCIILIGLAQSAAPGSTINLNNGLKISYSQFESHKINTPFNLSVHLSNISNGLAITGASCILEIYNATGEYILDTTLEPRGDEYGRYIEASNFTQVETISYTIYCNSTSVGGYDDGIVYITQSGYKASTSLEIFIWILFIIGVVGNLIVLILILVKLATTKETIFGVLNAWGLYLLLIITNFLSGFLTYTYITTTTDLLLTILVWSNGVLPLISLFITMFIKGTQKKRPIGINELTGQAPFGRFGR